MQRSFKYFTIGAGGTPQPLIGTTLTASVVAGSQVSCPVTDSSMFQKNDRVLLIKPDGTNGERARVFSVPDATHIVVDVLTKNHLGGVAGTGDWVALAEVVNSVYVQTLDGNTGALYIGTAPTMVKATGASVIAKLVQVGAGVQPTEFSAQRGNMDVENVSQLFVDGTTADSYLPSIGVI